MLAAKRSPAPTCVALDGPGGDHGRQRTPVGKYRSAPKGDRDRASQVT
jgi:hypothetical protein